MTRQEIEKLLIRADSLLSLLWHRHVNRATLDSELCYDVEHTIGLLRRETPKIVAQVASLEQLERALSHVLEFIPSDSGCAECASAKQLSYQCNSKIAKALNNHDHPR